MPPVSTTARAYSTSDPTTAWSPSITVRDVIPILGAGMGDRYPAWTDDNLLPVPGVLGHERAGPRLRARDAP